jgi:hypothetical protein
VEELEECLNLDELRLIIEAMREKELRNMKFFASLKGIDLDSHQAKSAEDQVQRIKDKVAAQQRGVSPEKFELENYFGTDYEVEE